jgi:hypothetical protein
MRIDELEKHEKLALGGLIRMMLRSDGEFAEDEEDAVDSLGDDVGGKAAIWRIVSDSAQALRSNDAVRDAAIRVTRPDARAVIRDALVRVAAADSIVESERALLDWLDAAWRA